jgi:hypothetical protein
MMVRIHPPQLSFSAMVGVPGYWMQGGVNLFRDKSMRSFMNRPRASYNG